MCKEISECLGSRILDVRTPHLSISWRLAVVRRSFANTPCACSTTTHVKPCQARVKKVGHRVLAEASRQAMMFATIYGKITCIHIMSAVMAGSAWCSAHLRPLWEDLPSWSRPFLPPYDCDLSLPTVLACSSFNFREPQPHPDGWFHRILSSFWRSGPSV
jgi:hypothetical protein